ncbi:MAG: PadR family transcriptional regulator [Acidimicrobiia bacterium]
MSCAMPPPWIVKRQMMTMGRGRGYGGRGRRGFGMGPGGFFPGRPKVSRGDVRSAILHLLAEGPMHGYQIMSELTERTDGIWQPSPGSIYPTLNQLEDEDLVRAEEKEGKKVYALTDQGRAQVEADEEEAPWERFSSPYSKGLMALRETGFEVGAAVFQVARAGSEEQVAKAREILEEARRRIYELLAGGEQTGD